MGKYTGILLLLLVAAALRLGWAISRPISDAAIDTLPDQREYLSIADSLLHGRGFSFLDKRFDETVYAFRMPGYPAFVAACGGNVRAVRIFQAIIDTSTVLATFLLGGLLLRQPMRWVGIFAAAVVAFNPFLIYFTGLILSETLFTAMLVWGMVLIIAGHGGRGPWRRNLIWLAGGVLLCLSVLVRPSAIALPILLAILAPFANRSVGRSYQDVLENRVGLLPPGIVIVAILLLCLLPWAVRNRTVMGRWIWLDTNSGFSLYDGYNPDATGGSDQRFIEREPLLLATSELGRDEYLSQKAVEYAREHPGRVWQLMLAKLGRTWSPMPLSSEYGQPRLRLISLVYVIPFDILVLAGLLWGTLPRPAKAFLLAPAIYLTVVHALTIGSLRYRIPADPPMAVIAAGILTAKSASWRRMSWE